MAGLARSILWAVAGSVASSAVRRVTRKALHTPYGGTRLPTPVRRTNTFGQAFLLAAGTGAVMALADVMKEQKKETVRKAKLHGDTGPERFQGGRPVHRYPENTLYQGETGYGRSSTFREPVPAGFRAERAASASAGAVPPTPSFQGPDNLSRTMSEVDETQVLQAQPSKGIGNSGKEEIVVESGRTSRDRVEGSLRTSDIAEPRGRFTSDL